MTLSPRWSIAFGRDPWGLLDYRNYFLFMEVRNAKDEDEPWSGQEV